MPQNNLEQNPDFIEARYGAESNQYDIELLAAAPDIVDFGSGGDGGSNLATSTALIQIGSRSIGGIGCPALDQYVLARGASGLVTSKLAGLLTLDDYLFNPLTQNFNPVNYTEFIFQPTARIKGQFNGETVTSWSHPLIKNQKGAKKTVQDCDWGEEVWMCNEVGEFVHPNKIGSIKYAGLRWTIRIELETEHIFATSRSASVGNLEELFFLGHNLKDPDEEL